MSARERLFKVGQRVRIRIVPKLGLDRKLDKRCGTLSRGGEKWGANAYWVRLDGPRKERILVTGSELVDGAGCARPRKRKQRRTLH